MGIFLEPSYTVGVCKFIIVEFFSLKHTRVSIMGLLHWCSLLLLSLLVVLSNATVYTPVGHTPTSLHAGLVLGANPNYMYAPCGDSVCSFNSNGELVQTVKLPAPTSQLVVDGFRTLLYAVLDTQESSAVLSCDGASLSVQSFSQYFASKGALAVVGANTFWANSSGVYSFTTKAASLVLASHLSLSGESSLLAYSRRSLFYFKTGKLHIISTALEAVSEFSFQGQARAVEFSANGEILYIATSTHIYIVDVSNLRNPVLKGSIATSATSLAVDGKLLLVGTESEGIRIYDVTSPVSARHVVNINTGKNDLVSGLIIRNNKLYVATREGLYLFSVVSNMATKQARSSRATSAYGASICNTQLINRKNGAETDDFDWSSMSSDGTRYLHIDNNGTLNIRRANTSDLTLLSTYSLGNSPFSGAYAWDIKRNLLFYRMPPSTSVYVLDHSNPLALVKVGSITTIGANSNQPSLILAGTTLYYGYYSDSGSQVYAYNASIPSNLALIGTTSFSVLTFINWHAWTAQNLFAAAPYGSTSQPTLQVYDIVQNPLSPTIVANVTFNGTSLSIVGTSPGGNLLYVTLDSVLKVLNLANPRAPTLNASISVGNYIQSVLRVNNLFWIASYSAGVLVYDSIGNFLTQNSVDQVTPTQMQPVISMTSNKDFVFASIYPAVLVYNTSCSNGSSPVPTTTSSGSSGIPTTSTTGARNTTASTTSTSGGIFTTSTGARNTTASTTSTGAFNSTLTSSTSASATTAFTTGLPTAGVPTTAGAPTTSSKPITTTTTTGGLPITTTTGSSGNGTLACNTALLQQIGYSNEYTNSFLIANGTKISNMAYVEQILAAPAAVFSPISSRNISTSSYPSDIQYDSTNKLIGVVDGSIYYIIIYTLTDDGVFTPASYIQLPSTSVQTSIVFTGSNAVYAQYYNASSSGPMSLVTAAYDISNLKTPAFVGYVNISFSLHSALFVGGFAYVATNDAVNVLDLSVLTTPKLVATLAIPVPGPTYIQLSADRVDKTKIYTLVNFGTYSQINTLNIALPTKLYILNSYSNSPGSDFFMTAVTVRNYLWIGSYKTGVWVVDVSVPIPVLVTTNALPYVVKGVQMQPSNLLMATSSNVLAPTSAGLFIFSANCVKAPATTAGLPTTGAPTIGTTGPFNGSTTALPTTGNTPPPTPKPTGVPTNGIPTSGLPTTTGGTSTTGGGAACGPSTCSPGYQCYTSSPSISTCIYWYVSSLISCNSNSGAYASMYAYGGATYNYTFDGNYIPASPGYQYISSLTPGAHVLGVVDNFGNKFTYRFTITCDLCKAAGCPYCLSTNSTYACITVQNAVAPCSTNGSITLSYYGNGLNDLQFSLDGGPASKNLNYTGVTSGTHLVSVFSLSIPGVTVTLNTTIISSTCGTFVYLGCFQDNYYNQYPGPSRDLIYGPYYEPDYYSMSAPWCVAKCLSAGPYKYAALQFTSECWCGNSYGKFGQLADTACNLRCGGSGPTTYCGGSNLNSIYDTGISIDYCQSQPCSGGSVCMNRVGTFSCVLPSVSYDTCTGSAKVTVNVTGTGSFTFTLSNGTSTNASTFTAAAGKYNIVVRDSFGYNATTSISVDYRAPFAINSTSWKYLGCFVENPTSQRDLPTGPYTNKTMTAAACASYCRGMSYNFMGLQNGVECWCGNSYGTYGAASDAACNYACVGESCRNCGGYKLNSIYNIGDACNPNPCNSTETCLLSGSNYACVAASLVQSKCNNDDGYIQLSARGTDSAVQWSLNNGAFSKASSPFQLIGLVPGSNVVNVQSTTGTTASFAFNVTALAVNIVQTPLPCQPNIQITPVYNRPYVYASTLVDTNGISWNISGGSYTVPTAMTYSFSAECSLSQAVTLATPSLPGPPGVVSASLNLATGKIIVTFDPPSALTIAVSQYILSVSDGGVTFRKVPIAGSGASIAFVYGTNYTFYVQAQTCDGLGATSALSSFLAATPPVAPSLSISGSVSSNGTAALGTVQWFVTQIALGDSLTYSVECNTGSGYYVCGNTSSKSVSLALPLSVNNTVRVRARNIAGQYGSYSNEIALYYGSPCATPATPTTTGFDYLTRTITISWTSVGSCTYNLEGTNQGAWSLLIAQQQTFWTSSTAYVEDNSYSFRVSACNAYGCSSPSNALTVVATANANVSISWYQTIPTARSFLSFSYTVQVSYDGSTWTNATTATSGGNGDQTVSAFVVINLDVSAIIRVVSKNANGYSQPSSTLNVTIPSPPKGTPLINTANPSSITQYGQVVITITGLNINANSKSQCKFTAITGSILVNATGVLGSGTIYCIAPAYPITIYAVTAGAWQLSITNDGTTWSTTFALSVSPAPYVSDASPVWIDSRGSYYYIDGQYFDSCRATYLLFGGGVLSGTFYQMSDYQEMEYLLPAGSIYSPFVNVQFYCDSILIYSGVIAYYDSTLVSTIAATTWNMATVGDESLTIPGNWANYAAYSSSLAAPQVRLSNKAQFNTYGYFYSSAQWSGKTMVLTEIPLPYSPSNAANNLFDIEISVDGGYTWYYVTKTGGQITVTSPSFSTSCASLSCSACNAVSSCLWFSKYDGRGWCSGNSKVVANALSSTQVGTTCDIVGISELFNTAPVAASFTAIDANTVELTVTLAFTFTQSSESPVTTIADVTYDIFALDSEANSDVQITSTPSYSYFTNYAASTTVQLQFSGVVAKSALSGSFEVDITYSNSADYYFSDTGYFNLLGGATITTSDIGSTETLFLLAAVNYLNDASYPNITVNFPSVLFATSAYLALDGTSVTTLTNAVTPYVINQNTLKLTAGVHTLTAVVNGQITSSFSFYVINAPTWMSNIRTDSNAVLTAGKGLSVHNYFPLKNILPAIVVTGDTNFVLQPTVSGTVDYSYPLNGLVAASFASSVTFPPTTLDNAAAGVLTIGTNLQTAVTGALPVLNLNSVSANAGFSSSLSVISYTKDLGFLGQLIVSTPFRFTTTVALNVQPNTGFDVGYGLKTTGTLSIVGDVDISPTNIQAAGSFSVTGVSKTVNINLAFDYSTANLVTASTFFANVTGTISSTGALKVVLYNGALATISCTTTGSNSTSVTLSCSVYSLANVDSASILAAFNIPTPVPAYTPVATSPPVASFSPPGSRHRSVHDEEEMPAVQFYAKNWAQIPFPESKKRDVSGASNTLVSDVYEGSASEGIKFSTLDTTSLAVWVGFNTSRPAPFGYNIQFSVFNSTALAWTNPASIDPSITVAGSPAVTGISGTSKFVAVWESQNLPSGTTITVEAALNTTEVFAGLYLADTKAWTITKLTSNSIYDGTPTICSTTLNGAQLVAAVWQQGNFLNPQNIVVAVGVIGTDIGATGTWTQPVTVATGIKTLSALSCSWSADTVAITYTQISGSSSPARVSMSLYVNENNTVTPVVPTITDSSADNAPVTTITSNGQFLSAWVHGSKILVASTLLDGSSGGSPIQISLSSQPSLVSISSTSDYVVITYYQTVGNTGTFYMQTLASGDTAFSSAVAILSLNQNEGAIAAQSQLIENSSGRQILLVFTSTVAGSITSHHYALIDLKPVINVQSVIFSANSDGSINVDLTVINSGTWALASGEKTAFIYDGDANGAANQLGSADLPALAVNAASENVITVTLTSTSQGYVWVEITIPSDTYLDFAMSYGYPVYTPTTANLAISALPTGGIVVSANIGASSNFKCSTVVVPCTLSTLDPSTSAYTTITSTTISVPCGSSAFVQINAAENQILGTLKLVAGTPIAATATVPFATSAVSTLPVSPYADIVVAASGLSVDSPFLGDAEVLAVVQNTAIFSASNVVVNVYINPAGTTSAGTTGTLVGTTTIAQLSAQSSITVSISLNAINTTGTYILSIVANPARTIPEANYVNDGALLTVTLSKNAWMQITATAIRVNANSVQFSVTNAGTANLDLGQVTVSVGSVNLGTVNVTNVKPSFCAIATASTSSNLLADTTAQVVISIPSPLSGSFSTTTVTTTVASASSTTLPTCGDVPVNAAPGLQADSLVAIVGIPTTIVISGTSVSPFLAPLLSFNITNLPSNSSFIDPCVNASNTGVLCKKEAFTFTAKLSDIPAGKISTTREIDSSLYTTSDNNTLASAKFNLTITSCGNGIKDPAEQCDGGANCTASCAFATTNSTGGTQSPSTSGTSAPSKGKSNHKHKLALGLGLGLGLFLPLIIIGGVAAYCYVKKNPDRRAVEMHNR